MAEIDSTNLADENKLARPTRLTRTCRRIVNRAFLPFTYFSLIIPPKLRKFKPRTWFLGVLLMGLIVLIINVIQADENSDLFINFGEDDLDDDLSSSTGFPRCRAEPHLKTCHSVKLPTTLLRYAHLRPILLSASWISRIRPITASL